MKFKVGDKAKVIGNTEGHFFEMGDIVTIRELFPEAKPPHYECWDGDDYWFLKDDELETV